MPFGHAVAAYVAEFQFATVPPWYPVVLSGVLQARWSLQPPGSEQISTMFAGLSSVLKNR